MLGGPGGGTTFQLEYLLTGAGKRRAADCGSNGVRRLYAIHSWLSEEDQ